MGENKYKTDRNKTGKGLGIVSLCLALSGIGLVVATFLRHNNSSHNALVPDGSILVMLAAFFLAGLIAAGSIATAVISLVKGRKYGNPTATVLGGTTVCIHIVVILSIVVFAVLRCLFR